MKNVLSNSGLVIFDLDGTLYEGSEHFDYYAKHLMKKLSPVMYSSFYEEYEMMKAGNHVVQIGKAYDVNRDCLLTIDPIKLTVIKVEEWTGTVWSEEQTNKTFPNEVIFDFENIVALGDGWWLPFTLAKHYGIEDCYSSYLATKEFMVTEDFELKAIPGLREWILQLQAEGKVTVLVTNSDKEDVLRLLKELDLNDVFSHIVSSARKPSYTLEIFKHLIYQYDVKEEMTVSIGDNFINEIAPALLLGMKGIYIHPHGTTDETEASNLKVVRRITECF
ncbi:HAD family hydrolase [Alkalihalobacterium elongatum]|uniref:HAD family hydrolase n=1 Tax=Alkalihalobacterium elongatum TaxID=2675466 RepID=UPI001C1F3373|nr:HAD family hydrolase [Alkalihalobacterium elongatum]